MQRVYLDNAATTRPDPRVIQACSRAAELSYGNPSSLHQEGTEAHQAMEDARRQVASLIGARPGEIFFTSGGTESNNLAIRGVLGEFSRDRVHLITTAIEHPSVLQVCAALNPHAVEVTQLAPDDQGIIDPRELENAIRPGTGLISAMAANNVVGTLQPIAECGRIARRHGIAFHVDATQAAGCVLLNADALGIDLLTISAHKMHGPRGVGALYVREGVHVHPLLRGGGQEAGLRSGTENLPAIVGFGLAAEIARNEMADNSARLVGLRNRLIDSVLEAIPQAYLIGHRYLRLPGFACFGFTGSEGAAIQLLLALDQAGFAVSSGSACSARHSGHEPSHVLSAMGFDPVAARGSLRVSLGRFNDRSDVDAFVAALSGAIADLTPIARIHRQQRMLTA